MKSKDLTGQRFGRLVVDGFDRIHLKPTGRTEPRWNCKCDCGVIKSILQQSLKSGKTQSCGCLIKEKATRLGMSRTRQYRIWYNMKSRCDNPNAANYAFYGQRGITYSPEWKTFEGFWEDMKDGYSDTLTLDRINSNGNYCKDNCQWATSAQQSRNRGKQSNNTSGKTGVILEIREGKPAYCRAQWYTVNGEIKRKCFSIRKYGEEAFRLACEYRDKQIEILNNQGAGYTNDHGI